MPLTEDDHVVEALPAQGADDPFPDRIRIWRSEGREHGFDPDRGRAGSEVTTPNPIPVADQVARPAAPGSCLEHLPPDPGRIGMGGDLKVDQLAAIMADEEDHIEGVEAQGMDHEEISCPNRLGVVGEEGPPALAGWTGGASLPIATDGSCTDYDPQLQEFAGPDPLSAPERVLDGHRPDQLLDLRFQVRPTHSRPGSPAPVETPALAVPTDDGRRPDHQQMTSPALIQAANQQPEQLVTISECEPGTSAKGGLKLLAEQQVFDDEMPPAAEAPQESAEQEWKQIKHQLSIADQPPWP